jgi:hypothetical protein
MSVRKGRVDWLLEDLKELKGFSGEFVVGSVFWAAMGRFVLVWHRPSWAIESPYD